MAIKQTTPTDEFVKGLWRDNPVFIQVLGMCPALAVSNTAINALAMGLATTFVLVMSNLVVSLIKSLIPDKVRIPSFIVIIATFVTVVELVMKGYVPALFDALGLFIPLIVVNCLVLGRAEAFASKNSIWSSLVDGMGMGLGFTMALTVLGAVRELLGSGAFFGLKLISGDALLLFILPPGAFIALGYLIVLANMIKEKTT